MLWRLERGPSSRAAAEGEILLRWGLPPASSLGLSLICSPRGELYRCEGGRQEIIALDWIAHPGDVSCAPYPFTSSITLHFYRQKWRTAAPTLIVPAAGLHLWIPWQGWQVDHWFDGPLIVAREDKILGWAAEGYPCRLAWDADGLEDGLPWGEVWERSQAEKAMSWAQSLSHGLALRLGLAPEQRFVLHDARWNAETAALLILLRKAYPQTFLMMGETPPNPAWRRLCQNLNIALQARPGNTSLSIAGLWPEVEEWGEFLSLLQTAVPILPEKLLASLRSS